MGFSPKELDIARQNLLDKVIEYFLNREGVEALYIQGSVAAGSADEFSDIDFRVVIQPEMYEQYTSERFSAPQHWGEWLYNEWTSDIGVCVSHFKPFNKIDVLYFKPEHLQPSLWYLLPTQVIYDPKNLVQQIIEASQEIESILEVDELERLVNKGLAYAEEAYRRVQRDELFYAQSLLDDFRSILMHVDDYFRNSPSPSAPASHFEQRGNQILIEVLRFSYTPLDKRLMLQALSELLGIYQNQVIKLHETLSLQRDKATDLSWINTILGLCRGYS